MLWTNIKYHAKLPFVNLGKRAKTIFAIRLCTLVVSIMFGSVIIGQNADRFPIFVLYCDRSNIAVGLYTALKDTFSGENNFVTTSELKILAEYIEDHIEDTPQFIKCGLFGWCSINYSYENYWQGFDFDGSNSGLAANGKHHSNYNITTSCQPYGSSYVFDYRSELSDIGLNIILAYAYTADFQTGDSSSISDTVYVPDSTYKKTLKSRKNAVYRFIVLSILVISLEALMFVGSFVYYSLRGNSTDDSKVPSWVKHLFAVISTTICILAYIAFIIIFLQMRFVQENVSEELSAYGIYTKFGRKFVTFMIFCLVFATFNFTLWAGPVWFNRSIQKKEDDIAQIPLSMDAYDYDYNYNDGDDERSYMLRDDNVTAVDDDDDDGDQDSDNSDSNDDLNLKEPHDTTKSIKTSDSFEGNEVVRELRASSTTASSTASWAEPINPFNKSVSTSNSEADLSNLRANYQNPAFLRSEELLGRRKPPLLKKSALTEDHLIPMSPIINNHKHGFANTIVPNIKLTNREYEDKNTTIVESENMKF